MSVRVCLTHSVAAAARRREQTSGQGSPSLWTAPLCWRLFSSPSVRGSCPPLQAFPLPLAFSPSIQPLLLCSYHRLPLCDLAAPDMAILHVCPCCLPALPRGPASQARVWFSLLSLSGPCPPPPPLGPFSPSLSRFRKEAGSAAPSGTTPPAQIPSTEKKPDPPVRPARPPGPFVTQEPHLGRNGMGASVPPTPTSALPFRPASLWPDRTGALLLPPVPLMWTGGLPCPHPLPF